ncbi:hypothetical protein FQA39_LY10152 [Lamprigera yunnana]|nr:hypothetical protein FQA39_LY10152 [Lamprigera yunnana]
MSVVVESEENVEPPLIHSHSQENPSPVVELNPPCSQGVGILQSETSLDQVAPQKTIFQPLPSYSHTSVQEIKVLKRKNPKNRKKMELESTDKEEVDEMDLVDDDEVDNIEKDTDQNEQCLICEEFGKNKEMWYSRVLCGCWAHAECSGQDSPKNYHCDYCQKIKRTKKRFVL